MKNMPFLCILYEIFIYLQCILLIINVLKNKNREYKNESESAEKAAGHDNFR